MKSNKTLLAVDDEPRILEVVCAYFESVGFRVLPASSGRQALDIFGSEPIALVLLDLMLPDMSGEDVCRAIRLKSRVPILMLTAKAEEANVLTGLQIGADDYIVKPFRIKELGARVEAVLRRADSAPLMALGSFGDGDLVVDFAQNLVKKKGVPVALTPSEMNILSTLTAHPGRVFTRAALIDAALGSEFEGYDRAIDSHVKNLRQKIEDDPKAPVYVKTVHGLGYKFGGE